MTNANKRKGDRVEDAAHVWRTTVEWVIEVRWTPESQIWRRQRGFSDRADAATHWEENRTLQTIPADRKRMRRITRCTLTESRDVTPEANGGLDTEFKPGDDSLMMLAKLAAKTDTDGCLDQRIIDYIKIGKLDIE